LIGITIPASIERGAQAALRYYAVALLVAIIEPPIEEKK
jgi:hypothetical protein